VNSPAGVCDTVTLSYWSLLAITDALWLLTYAFMLILLSFVSQ